MKEYRVGILGATGAVGREMMKVLAERKHIRQRSALCGERAC